MFDALYVSAVTVPIESLGLRSNSPLMILWQPSIGPWVLFAVRVYTLPRFLDQAAKQLAL